MATKYLRHCQWRNPQNIPPPTFQIRLLSSLQPFLQSPPSTYDQQIDTILQIINESPNPQILKQTLNSFNIHISNDLVDGVLKRVRFSHTNPLRALEFFNLSARTKGFLHTQYSLDNMLYILGRSRLYDHIWNVLLETKKRDRNLISHRTVQVVLGRIAKVCSARQTVEALKKFRKLVPVFDTACYNALLRTLCQEKSMSDARNVYHGLKREFKPNLQTLNILLAGWKSSEEAEEFFKEMKDMGVEPDVVSYNSLIDVYCKNMEIDKAYKVFDEMRERDITPDVITYTSLIGGLGLVGQPDKARDVLKEMREYGCYPDAAAYNAAIRNYCIAKRMNEAFGLMDEMTTKGLSPNSTTYNLFFRVFYWSNDLRSSWGLYRKMKAEGCLPKTQSCMFLIRLCKKQEKADVALELWDDMVEKGFGSFTLVSDVLFDLLCDLGKLDGAERCFLQMVEKGQKPSGVSFRRIKVLMELANRKDALQKLSEKMEMFRPSVPVFDNDGDPMDRVLSRNDEQRMPRKR